MTSLNKREWLVSSLHLYLSSLWTQENGTSLAQDTIKDKCERKCKALLRQWYLMKAHRAVANGKSALNLWSWYSDSLETLWLNANNLLSWCWATCVPPKLWLEFQHHEIISAQINFLALLLLKLQKCTESLSIFRTKSLQLSEFFMLCLFNVCKDFEGGSWVVIFFFGTQNYPQHWLKFDLQCQKAVEGSRRNQTSWKFSLTWVLSGVFWVYFIGSRSCSSQVIFQSNCIFCLPVCFHRSTTTFLRKGHYSQNY